MDRASCRVYRLEGRYIGSGDLLKRETLPRELEASLLTQARSYQNSSYSLGGSWDLVSIEHN